MENFKPAPKRIKLGILGMGAIGQLMAWHCQSASNCYALTNQPTKHCDFQVRSESLSQQVSVPSWEGQPLDVLLVCVKAQQTENAIEQWRKAISPETQIVLLQNGLGQQQTIAKQFPEHTVFAASSTEGANRDIDNVLNYAGVGETLWGHFSGPASPLRLPIENIAGNHKTVHNIQQVLLDKLAINAVINPLTVKYDCRNGTLIEQSAPCRELRQLVSEIESIIQAAGLTLSYPLLQRSEQVCSNTAMNISSMLQDIRAKKHTEIDFITGYICQLARQHNSPYNINRSLYDYVREHEPGSC